MQQENPRYHPLAQHMPNSVRQYADQNILVKEDNLEENFDKLRDILDQNLDEMKDHYRRGGLGDMKCKKLLNSILNELLEPIRKRRHELEQDIPEIYNILRRGTEKARETAAQTMDEVRNAMKISYFDDAELIRQQSEYFKNK